MAKTRKADERNNVAVKCGERIRHARESRGWTLVELSNRTGQLLSPSRISNYEQGLRLPKSGEALILSRALGTSAAYLLGVAEEDEVNKLEMELLRNWRALPERDRNAYARRIAALAIAYKEPVTDERLEQAYGRPTPAPGRRRRPVKK